MISAVRKCEQVCLFQHMEHFDLLVKLWEHRGGNWHLQKVQAHVDVVTITDPLSRYWRLGNALADVAAQTANDKLIPELVHALRDQTADTQRRRDFLEQVYRLHLQLHAARVMAEQNLDEARKPCLTQDKLFKAFAEWTVEPSWSMPQQLNLDFLTFCPYGHQNACDMLLWLQRCVWREDTIGPLQRSTGMSWIEMAVSWVFTFKLFLPITREVKQGHKQVLVPGTYESALQWGMTLAEQGAAFCYLFDSVTALIPQRVAPPLKRIRGNSLYMLGCSSQGHGPSFRPVVPHQAEMVAWLIGVFKRNPKANSEETPMLHVETSEDILGEGPFLTKATRARNKMAIVRQLRTELYGK